ncbi:MAG TPA: hypothetical protein VFP05_14155 [Thermomicrobiales bacterium]|nr:hypothetical protein [Thermomicrobiales bacterium]
MPEVECGYGASVALGACDDGCVRKSERKICKLLNEIGNSGPVVFTTIELEAPYPNVSQECNERGRSEIALDKVRDLRKHWHWNDEVPYVDPNDFDDRRMILVSMSQERDNG